MMAFHSFWSECWRCSALRGVRSATLLWWCEDSSGKGLFQQGRLA